MKRLAILGSAMSGGAGQILEALNGNGEITPVAILDNEASLHGTHVFGVQVLGATMDVEKFWKQNLFDVAVIAIGGNLEERKRLFDEMNRLKIPMVNIIDPDVRLGMEVKIGSGNVILNSTYLGNHVVVGNNNYILNQCSVQHDTIIGDHNYLATNVSIGAKVKIGDLNRLKMKSVLETGVVLETATIINTAEVVKNKL